uniref:Uncharacterized protein n=1 Tax=Pipistrellus kuhlii TaxID=59472 RepID=A0A7J7VMK7_PIPKU|nr:hypothetical protein mPipKuh1_008409 [Pipistrellus kuhlii]
MRERHRSAASCTLPTGDVPATKVHALDLSVHRLTLYPLSQTGFGSCLLLRRISWWIGKSQRGTRKAIGEAAVEVQAAGDRSACEDQERGRVLRCGQKLACRGLDVDVDVDVDGEGEPSVAPSLPVG